MKKATFIMMAALFVFTAMPLFAQNAVTTSGGEGAPNAVKMDSEISLTWLARPSQVNLAGQGNSGAADTSYGWIGYADLGFTYDFGLDRLR
jgi:hypothetical protein